MSYEADELEEMYSAVKRTIFKENSVPWGQRLAVLMLVQRRVTDRIINNIDRELLDGE